MNVIISPENWVDSAITLFESNKTDKAKAMGDYMKNHVSFYGIQKPARAELMKSLYLNQGIPGSKSFREVASLLWDKDFRELHYLAMDVLFRNKKNFFEDDIFLLEEMMRVHAWWDTVDYLSPTLAFHLFRKFPQLKMTTLRKWNTDSSFWLRRASIIAQLKEKESTDIELQFSLITPLAQENEFFIRKAIGWSLRELSKYYPNEVVSFTNHLQLSALSKKEALRLINKSKN